MNGTEPTPDPDNTTATGEPPAAGAGDPGTAPPGDAAPGQSGREPPPAQPGEPLGKEESVRQARRRGQESPRAILLEFFYSAFHSEEALRDFCFAHFQLFEREIKETDRFREVVRRLIRHCESRGHIQDLWDRVATENKAKYDEWFPRWLAAERKYRNAREAEYAEFRDAALPRRPDSAPTPSEHPLSSGNPEAVSDWFFTDLGPAERGTVLATALFQGMHRTYLVGVGQDFAKLFDPAAHPTADDGSARP